MGAAAAAGQLASCKWLVARGCPWHVALEAAAGQGRRAVCQWLLDNICSISLGAVIAAARGGHVGFMYWLLQQLRDQARAADASAHPLQLHLLAGAAHGCSLPDVQRLHEEEFAGARPRQQAVAQSQRPPSPHQQQQQLPQLPHQAAQPLQEHEEEEEFHAPPRLLATLVLAAAAGSPTPDWQAKFEWLEPWLAAPRHVAVCEAAAAVRPYATALERLRWLRGRGYPAASDAARAAAAAGNVAALRFLLASGVRPNFLATASAFAEGHLDVLRELHRHGCALRPALHVASAARSGHLLEWLEGELRVHRPRRSGGQVG